MGDHRCSIKIEMEFHGVKDKLDGYYSWFPGAVDGVDDRVIEFIRDVYQRGMEVYHEEVYEAQKEQKRAEIEKREREELERLKKKYEGSGNTVDPKNN